MQSNQKIVYFLRGMGVGLFFAGCVFTVLSKDVKRPVAKEELSKEEIMAAAKEYGMVEEMDAKLDELKNQVTSAPTKEEATPVPGSTNTPSQDTESEKEQNESEKEQNESEKEQNESEKEQNESENTESEKELVTPQPTVNPSGLVKFEIVPGDNGKTVSQKLEDAGVIKSASKFNSYLKKYDHAKKIRIGTFELNKSDSYYEIAIAITGK